MARIRAARLNATGGGGRGIEGGHPGFPTPEQRTPPMRPAENRRHHGGGDIPDDMQQALLQQSLGPGTTPRYTGPEVHRRRDDRVRSRTADGPSRAAMLLVGATMRDVAEARLRTQSHNPDETTTRRARPDANGLTPDDVGLTLREAPPAPRLAHRVPGPSMFEAYTTPGTGQTRSPVARLQVGNDRPLTPMPGPSFITHTTSPTPTTAVPADGLLPALYRANPQGTAQNDRGGPPRR